MRSDPRDLSVRRKTRDRRLDAIQIFYLCNESKAFHLAQVRRRAHPHCSRIKMVTYRSIQSRWLRKFDSALEAWPSRRLLGRVRWWGERRVLHHEGTDTYLAVLEYIPELDNLRDFSRRSVLLSHSLQLTRFSVRAWRTIQCDWPICPPSRLLFQLLWKFPIRHGWQLFLPQWASV